MTITETARRRRLPAPAVRRGLRQDARLTQSDLADDLGVNQATVARWELGDREPRGVLREQYAALLRALAAEAGSQ